MKKNSNNSLATDSSPGLAMVEDGKLPEDYDDFGHSGDEDHKEEGPRFPVNPHDPLDLGGTPSEISRRCTDFSCVVAYVLCLLVVGVVGYFGWQNGDLNELWALPDWDDKLCGHQQHRDQTLLYFCLKNPPETRQLDLINPICVHECPSSKQAYHLCPVRKQDPGMISSKEATTAGNLPWKSVTQVEQPVGYRALGWLSSAYKPTPITNVSAKAKNYTMSEIHDYPAFDFVGMVCLPWEGDLQHQVHEWILTNPVVSLTSAFIRSYRPLIAAFVNSVLLSFIYLSLLKDYASFLVWTGLTIFTAVPTSTGIYYLLSWYYGGGWSMSAESNVLNLAGGSVSLLVGVTFMCMSCRLVDEVDQAVACIQWSCKAILATPTLKLQPLLTLVIRIFWLAVLAGVMSLVFTSELHRTEAEGVEDFFHPLQYLSLAFLAFVAFWTQQVITAFSDFVIIYTTEMWYFKGGLRNRGNAPLLAIFQAWLVCMRYHLGTALLGGLVIGLVQPFRIILGILTSASRMEHNAVGSVLTLCCACFVSFYESLLQPLCSNAYMDLALNGGPFFDSAWHAREVVLREAGTVHILNGATKIFQIAGLGLVSGLVHVQTAIYIHTIPGYMDQQSEFYVQNPQLLLICGAVIGFIVAFPFMMLFHTVSDTILFCRTVERLRHMKDNPSLYERACTGGFATFFEEMASRNCSSRPTDHSFKAVSASDES